MRKIKIALQKNLKAFANFLGKSKLHKIIPFRREIYDFLFQHTWPYGNFIEIQGSRMYINIHDKDKNMRETFRSYALSLIHEESTTNLFKKVVKKGNIVVDLGANIGYFTLLGAKLVGEKGKIFAFEPEPKNFYYLKKNIELNNYQNIIAEQKAVSYGKGRTKLFICPYDSGHHTIDQFDGIEAYRLKRKGEITSIDIETVGLDNYFKDKIEDKVDRVDIIKIDVEGAEALAISGMKRILKDNENVKIFLEFFPLLIKKMGNSPQKLIESFLKDFNFNIFIIGQDYSMEKFSKNNLQIKNYQELSPFLKNKFDHINLYLTRD